MYAAQYFPKEQPLVQNIAPSRWTSANSGYSSGRRRHLRHENSDGSMEEDEGGELGVTTWNIFFDFTSCK